MNLIDRDTLDDYLGKWADDFYENPENSDADFMDGYCMTLNRIHSGAVPEVDAEPVRNGRWIRDEFGTKCGACGLYAYRDKFDQPWESPYCPNCGAKMDGEQHDHTD